MIENFENVVAVSPEIEYAHSPDETLYVDIVSGILKQIIEVLKELAMND